MLNINATWRSSLYSDWVKIVKAAQLKPVGNLLLLTLTVSFLDTFLPKYNRLATKAGEDQTI